MKRTITIVSLAVGLGIFAASTASAQFLSKINFSGKFTYDTSSTSGSVTTYKMINNSFNNKSLIDFFNNSPYFVTYVGTIPSGSYFVLDEFNDVIVTNKSGFSRNLSSSWYSSYYGYYYTPLYISFGGSWSATGGKYNSSTSQENERGMAVTASIYFDDGWDDYANIQGLLKSKYNASAVKSGMQNVNASGTITGYGGGWLLTKNDGYEPGVVQGKASAHGHGKISAP